MHTLKSKPDSKTGITHSQQVQDGLQTMLAEEESITLSVNGNCMVPSLRDDEQVTVYHSRRYLPGDLVAYYCPRRQQRFIHRFLGYVYSKGKRKCLIMADNVKKPDPLVDADAVLGKVITRNKINFQVSMAKRVRSVFLYGYCLPYLVIRKRLLRR